MPAVPARAPQATPEGNPTAGLAFSTEVAETLRPRMKMTNGRLIAPGGTPKDVLAKTTRQHYAAQGIDITKMTPQQAAALEKARSEYLLANPQNPQNGTAAGQETAGQETAGQDGVPTPEFSTPTQQAGAPKIAPGVSVSQMLQPAPATPEANKGNPFAAPVQTPIPTIDGGIKLAPPGSWPESAPMLPGKGDVMQASNPISGGSFAAVKPKPTSTTTPGTIGSTGVDRLLAKSAGAVPYGVTEGNNGTMGGTSVPTRTLTGPFNDTSLPMGVRMQSWNDATTANSPNATGNVNKRNVINTGPGQTFNEGMKSTGAPMTAEGKLLNPGQDMAAGMTYTKPDGTVLTYTRPGAGKGGPAPLRLTGVTRPQNDRVNYDTDVETGAISVTTRNGEGGKTTHRYDGNSPNLAGLGNPTGKTVENADGSRQVYDPRTGNVVGTSSPVAGRPQNTLVDRGADKPATQILANGKAGEVPRAQPVFTPQAGVNAPTVANANRGDTSFQQFQAGESNKDWVAKQSGGLIDGKPAGAVIASGDGGRNIKPVVQSAFAQNPPTDPRNNGAKPSEALAKPRTVQNSFWRKADLAMNTAYPNSPVPTSKRGDGFAANVRIAMR
jgi:hypothetical protein